MITRLRTFVSFSAAMVAGLLVAACGSNPEPTPTAMRMDAAREVSSAPSTPAGRLLEAINRVRAENGLRPLSAEPRLKRAASGHASDMADGDFFAHRGSNGSSFAKRVTKAGYGYRFVGENIAAGLASPDETVESWMSSPGHRRNVLSREAIHAGIGYAFRPRDGGNVDYGHYWVLLVGCAVETHTRAPDATCR